MLGNEAESGRHGSCGAPVPGFDYLSALANERAFLARQNITLGLLAVAVGVRVAFASSLPGLGYVLGIVLAVTAILTAGVELIRCQRIDRGVTAVIVNTDP